MSIKQKFISGIALAFAVGAFGTFASAQDKTTAPDDSMQKQERPERRGERGGMRDEKHGFGGDRMMMHALGKLNLTDSQKEQVKVLFDNFRTANQPQMEEMRGLGMKRHDGGTLTADEQTRFDALRAQMKTANEQLQTSVLAILTAEQRAQFDKLKEEQKQEMKERRENRQNQADPTTLKDN